VEEASRAAERFSLFLIFFGFRAKQQFLSMMSKSAFAQADLLISCERLAKSLSTNPTCPGGRSGAAGLSSAPTSYLTYAKVKPRATHRVWLTIAMTARHSVVGSARCYTGTSAAFLTRS